MLPEVGDDLTCSPHGVLVHFVPDLPGRHLGTKEVNLSGAIALGPQRVSRPVVDPVYITAKPVPGIEVLCRIRSAGWPGRTGKAGENEDDGACGMVNLLGEVALFWRGLSR